MSTPENGNWQWSDLDPMTRSVVAAFAWRIGDEANGDISSDGFIGAMTETFVSMTSEDVIKTAYWHGPQGMRNAIVNKLSGFEAEPINRMVQRLGELAGGSEAALALATQTGEQLHSRRIYDAIPGLQVLVNLPLSATPCLNSLALV